MNDKMAKSKIFIVVLGFRDSEFIFTTFYSVMIYRAGSVFHRDNVMKVCGHKEVQGRNERGEGKISNKVSEMILETKRYHHSAKSDEQKHYDMMTTLREMCA